MEVASPSPAHAWRILVADGDDASRRRLVDQLRALAPGASLHEAADAESALALVESVRPHLVVLDLLRPHAARAPPEYWQVRITRDHRSVRAEYAGLRFLRALLARDQPAHVAVVTGLPDDHPDVAAARRMGVLLRPQRPPPPRRPGALP